MGLPTVDNLDIIKEFKDDIGLGLEPNDEHIVDEENLKLYEYTDTSTCMIGESQKYPTETDHQSVKTSSPI